MGKDQGLGFVDKHIEKVIFLGCLVVMLYVVVQYGLSSSREFEVMGKAAPPGKVDETLLSEAQQIERRYNSQKPKDQDVPDVRVDLEQRQGKPLPPTLAKAMIDLGGISKPKAGTGEVVGDLEAPSLKDVAQSMPAPVKPVASLLDEMTVVLIEAADRPKEGRPGADQAETIRESVSLHAITSYPYETLSKKWDDLFTKSSIYPKVVPLAYDVQLQVEASDGTWSDVKDKFVRLPHPKYGVVPELKLKEFDGTNGDRILQDQREILKSGVAALAFHPDYPTIMTDDVDVPWSAFMTGHPEFVERYFAKENVVGPGQREPEKTEGPAGIGHVVAPAEDAAAGPQRTELELKEEALRGPMLPSYEAQLAGDSLLAWAHASELEYNKNYRIRFRIVFVNPLLTYIRDVNREYKEGDPIPADAKAPTVETAWSEWSDPMQVREQLDFFVTGENANRKQLTVTIFAKKFGQRIQCTVRDVVPGRAIRGSEQVEVLNPLTGEVHRVGVDLPTFAFDTGAVAVDCRFDGRVFTEGGSEKRGIAELTLADRDGKLHKRMIYVDRNSADYRRLKEEVKATQARLRGDATDVDATGRKLTPKERYLQRKEKRRLERQRQIDSRNQRGPGPEMDEMDRYRDDSSDYDPRRDDRRDYRRDDDRRR
jgi:hypothetical protein